MHAVNRSLPRMGTLKVVASGFGQAESGDKSPHSKIAPARIRFGVRRFIAATRAPACSVTAVPLLRPVFSLSK